MHDKTLFEKVNEYFFIYINFFPNKKLELSIETLAVFISLPQKRKHVVGLRFIKWGKKYVFYQGEKKKLN